jgi:phosphoribosyl 1,2-cyclic phosphodiesterase
MGLNEFEELFIILLGLDGRPPDSFNWIPRNDWQFKGAIKFVRLEHIGKVIYIRGRYYEEEDIEAHNKLQDEYSQALKDCEIDHYPKHHSTFLRIFVHLCETQREAAVVAAELDAFMRYIR